MNFGMLKNMVENLVSTYKCPFCGGTNIGEKNIDIVGAAGNTVNIDMHCPSCDKHFMAKTEVMQVELWNMNEAKLQQLHKSLMALKWKLGGEIQIESDDIQNEDAIKDENIVDLRKDMQKGNFNASDLFSDEESHD